MFKKTMPLLGVNCAVVTHLACLAAVPVATACDPSSLINDQVGSLQYEWGGTVEWRDAPVPARSEAVTEQRGGCPVPACVPDNECITYETNTAFVRPSELAEDPIYVPPVVGSYCFSLAKANELGNIR